MGKSKANGFLTRADIDSIIERMSAADLVKAMDAGSEGAAMPVRAFDHAAERLGMSNGTPASERVKMADFKHLAKTIGEAVNVDNPLSEGQEA